MCQPFDIISRLGNEEALSVAVNFDVRTGVNGDGTRAAFLGANFQGNQQQFQLDETHPATPIGCLLVIWAY